MFNEPMTMFYDTKSVMNAVFCLLCVLLVTHNPFKFDSLCFDTG